MLQVRCGCNPAVAVLLRGMPRRPALVTMVLLLWLLLLL
jgi:hypothetical protein